MADVKGFIQVVGDFGNPAGTGVADISLYGLTDEAHADVEAKLDAFYTALTTAQLCDALKGDKVTSYKDVNFTDGPGTGVNIDRIMVVTWRQKSDARIRRLTIPAVPQDSTSLEDAKEGERLNEAGKTALAAALNAVYGLTDDVVVLQGKVLQKA